MPDLKSNETNLTSALIPRMLILMLIWEKISMMLKRYEMSVGPNAEHNWPAKRFQTTSHEGHVTIESLLEGRVQTL
jgi:hypothetical protein